MEFIRFVFSDFWIWLGVLILIAATGNAVAETIKAFKPSRRIEAYRIGERLHVKIDGASKSDVAAALMYAKDGGADREVVE